MILFTVIEAINKLLGLLIFSIYARVLGLELFAVFSATLIILSYYVEVSFYSYQIKHLSSYNKDKNSYLESEIFSTRVYITLIMTLFSALIFYLLTPDIVNLNVLPLLLVFLCVPLTIDFVAFGVNKSTYIVVSRFFSQLIALAALWLMEKNYFPKQDVFLVNAAQTIILTLLIPAFLFTSNQLPLKSIITNLLNNRPNFSLLFQAFKDQTPVFLSRIAVIAVVTIEIPMLLLIKNPLSGNVALGNRIAIILLPFIYFYLNKNIDNVREKNITIFAAYVFLICCTIILISPLLVFMLFGESYLHRTNEFNFFIVNILIMSLVNFRFVSTSHDVTSYKYFLSLAPPMAISCIMICALYFTKTLTLTNLIMIFYIKNLLIIFMSLNAPVTISLRIASMALITAMLNIGLHHFGYFAEISDILKLLAPKLLNLYFNN